MARRPGWEHAYLDYESLKLLLSQIEAVYEEEGHRQRNVSPFDATEHRTSRKRNRSGVTDYRDELFNESNSDLAYASSDKELEHHMRMMWSDEEDESQKDNHGNGNGTGLTTAGQHSFFLHSQEQSSSDGDDSANMNSSCGGGTVGRFGWGMDSTKPRKRAKRRQLIEDPHMGTSQTNVLGLPHHQHHRDPSEFLYDGDGQDSFVLDESRNTDFASFSVDGQQMQQQNAFYGAYDDENLDQPQGSNNNGNNYNQNNNSYNNHSINDNNNNNSSGSGNNATFQQSGYLDIPNLLGNSGVRTESSALLPRSVAPTGHTSFVHQSEPTSPRNDWYGSSQNSGNSFSKLDFHSHQQGNSSHSNFHVGAGGGGNNGAPAIDTPPMNEYKALAEKRRRRVEAEKRRKRRERRRKQLEKKKRKQEERVPSHIRVAHAKARANLSCHQFPPTAGRTQLLV